jgi:hypothetical protein
MKAPTIHEQFGSCRKVVNLVSAMGDVVTIVTLFLQSEVLKIRTFNQNPNEPSPLEYRLKLCFNAVLKRRGFFFLFIHFLVPFHHLNQAVFKTQMF